MARRKWPSARARAIGGAARQIDHRHALLAHPREVVAVGAQNGVVGHRVAGGARGVGAGGERVGAGRVELGVAAAPVVAFLGGRGADAGRAHQGAAGDGDSRQVGDGEGAFVAPHIAHSGAAEFLVGEGVLGIEDEHAFGDVEALLLAQAVLQERRCGVAEERDEAEEDVEVVGGDAAGLLQHAAGVGAGIEDGVGEDAGEEVARAHVASVGADGLAEEVARGGMAPVGVSDHPPPDRRRRVGRCPGAIHHRLRGGAPGERPHGGGAGRQGQQREQRGGSWRQAFPRKVPPPRFPRPPSRPNCPVRTAGRRYDTTTPIC